MNSAIAIIGMACCYPDAKNPLELWENVLAQRCAFRRIPPERLRLQDYLSGNPTAPDATYAAEAALVEGYEFDRVRFRVAGPTYRSVDLAHWLALDVADQALTDAGFPDARGLPAETTGVLIGNTLTGEFSRAATLRLRWPYVRRVVETRLCVEGWEETRRLTFLRELEELYKAPFPAVGEETLAGALSNTIAGRICNYFHLRGGGYTIDGACSASLLAVAKACSALGAGELDAALAGGVDLSLDPFELVGFAKAGALARGEMRIYDTESSGFLPGEGSGFVVLMRSEDALAQGLRTYATIHGWGVSSDGGGGITRPEVRGQSLALERAYRRAGYGVETVALFEGHGTGTPVGDEVELTTLSAMRRAACGKTPPAAIGSIKANFGHTKAAAGIAGLIKATLAVHHQLLPPTTGVRHPRPEVEGKGAMLRVLTDAEPWPEDVPLRAGINSFGFGGINVHVAIEANRKENNFSTRERRIVSSAQDVELFLLDAHEPRGLADQIAQLAELAPKLSYSELADIAATLSHRLGGGRARAAVIAATPAQLGESLEKLSRTMETGVLRHVDLENGAFLGICVNSPRITFLFPGQASPVRLRAGIHGRRFPDVQELYRTATLPVNGDPRSTDVAQLAIVTAELAGVRLLRALGIEANAAIGHSLGELTAYYWAEALEERPLLEMVRARGRLMSEIPGPRGAMASISAGPSQVESLIKNGEQVVIACFNAPDQIVISGENEAVTRVVSRAQELGWTAILLSTSHAFHSPLMSPGTEKFRDVLASLPIGSIRRPVVSTITGSRLSGSSDLPRLLVAQFTSPVRYLEAFANAEQSTDLFLEVGPGQILTHLLQGVSKVPVVALDVAGPSLAGVLQATAAAYVLGGTLRLDILFDHRFTRPFDLDWHPRFFSNPCELAQVATAVEDLPHTVPEEQDGARKIEPREQSDSIVATSESAMAVVRELVARRAELPIAAVSEGARLLGDLHLNSIVVSEVVAAAARRLGVPPPGHLLQFADSTVRELAKGLEQLRAGANSVTPEQELVPVGIGEWYRAFLTDWVRRPLQPSSDSTKSVGNWRIFGPSDHPLLEPLSRARLPGSGVIVCMSAAPLEEQIRFLLSGAHAALQTEGAEGYFVVVGRASLAGAFVRTLGLERPSILTRVIDCAIDSHAIDYLREEISSNQHHVESRYDTGGLRYEPCFRLLEHSPEDIIPIQPGEVVLVSGGGKGIAADCALTLAEQTGATLVLLGRSGPEDALLSAHLCKVEARGVRAKYISADVRNLQAVRAAVNTAREMYGDIVAIIHGAGRNEPKLLRDLDEATLRSTMEPKVEGFRNLVEAVNPDHLRLLATFGSIIGRVGLPGEADYALANSYLSRLTEEFARLHPQCRCLALESSAWSGIGMAERLGKVEALRNSGISVIPRAEGVAWFRNLVARTLPATTVVLTGRLGAISPIPIYGPPLPLLRFLDRPLVHYQGVELVIEADLTTASDPYLLDHVFQGEPLLPAVVGLEAMAQAAIALASEKRIPIFEDVRFERPIVVEVGARVTVRIAALVKEPGRVEVALRSSRTSFQVDHFRCSCVFADLPLPCERVVPVPGPSLLPVNPERDLYGSLFFQGARFQRVAGYRRLSARFSWADIAAGSRPTWFSQYLPSTLILGDPAARDAALHSIQACVPQSILLPLGVDRLSAGPLDPEEELVARAAERWSAGDTYCYDLELRTTDGILRECWEGLRLRKVADAKRGEWPDALVAAFLEWRVREASPSTRIFAAFERDHTVERRRRTELAIQRAVDAPWPVRWRADGKPEVDAPLAVSAAHADGLTLAVAGPQAVACDLEPVRARSEDVWRDLLGPERWLLARLIANQADEDLQTAATRVWTAVESLTKAGTSQNGPLVLVSSLLDKLGGISLAAPGWKIVTSVIRFRDDPTPVAIAVLARSEECVTTNIDTESVSKRRTS